MGSHHHFNRLERVEPTYRFRATSPRRDESPGYATSKEQTVKRIYSSVPKPFNDTFPMIGHNGQLQRAVDEYATPVENMHRVRTHPADSANGRSAAPAPAPSYDGHDWKGEAFRLQDELQRMAQQMLDYRHATEAERKALSHRALEDELTILERERQLERVKLALEAAEARIHESERRAKAAEESEQASRAAIQEAMLAIEAEREKAAALAQSLERSERELMSKSQILAAEGEDALREEVRALREEAQKVQLQLQEAVKKIVETERERDAALQVPAVSDEETERLRKEVAKHELALVYLREEVAEARGRLLEEQARCRGKTLEVEELQNEIERLRSAAPEAGAAGTETPEAAASAEAEEKLAAAEARIAALEAELAETKEAAANATAAAAKPPVAAGPSSKDLRQQIADTMTAVRRSYAGETVEGMNDEALKKLQHSLAETEARVSLLMGETSFLENEVTAKERQLIAANAQRAEIAELNERLKAKLDQVMASASTALPESDGTMADAEAMTKLKEELDAAALTISKLLGEAAFLENDHAVKDRALEQKLRDHEAVRNERDTLKAQLTRRMQQSSIIRGEDHMTPLDAEEEGAAGAAEDPLNVSQTGSAAGGDPLQSMRRKIFELEQKNSSLIGEAALMENDLHGRDKVIEKLKKQLAEAQGASAGGGAEAAAPQSGGLMETKLSQSETRTPRSEGLWAKQQASLRESQVQEKAQLDEEPAVDAVASEAQAAPVAVVDPVPAPAPAAPEHDTVAAPVPVPEPESEHEHEPESESKAAVDEAKEAEKEKATAALHPAASHSEAAKTPIDIAAESDTAVDEPQPASAALPPAPAPAPAPLPAPAAPADPAMVTYSITVETEAPKGPADGTPDIILQVFGTESGMEPEIDPSVIALGTSFLFDCTTEDLGQLAAVRLWHNMDSGFTFVVKRVIVFNRNDGVQTVFEVQKEVGKGEDASVMVTL